MSKVYVAGIGIIPFRKRNEWSSHRMGQEAVVAGVKDSGLQPTDIQSVYCGTAMGGMLMGQRITRDIGLSGLPLVNMDNACSSGSTALYEACHAVKNGQYDVALAVGVEKLSLIGSGAIPLNDEDFEVQQGQIMPAVYAMRAQRYLHEYGGRVEDLALVAVKNRQNAVFNPVAQFRSPVTIEEVIASRPIAEPLTLLQSCPKADGAAAAVIVSERYRNHRSIEIRASHLTSGRFSDGHRDMTIPEITLRSASETYEEAGIGPEDIHVAEVHDAFSIAEIQYYEALGFCGRGEGLSLLKSGATGLRGKIPVNPSGGLLCKGHPLGATGIAQIAEIVEQLRGDAGSRQIENPRVGLAHCTGGGIYGLDHGACAIHILVK